MRLFYIKLESVSTMSATLLAVFFTIFLVPMLADFDELIIASAEQTASVVPTPFIIFFDVLIFIAVSSFKICFFK